MRLKIDLEAWRRRRSRFSSCIMSSSIVNAPHGFWHGQVSAQLCVFQVGDTKKQPLYFDLEKKFAIDNLNTKITLPHARKCVNNLIHETFTTQENMYWNQACYGSNNMMKSFIFSCLICLITLELRSQSWPKLLANQDDNKVSVKRSLSVLHN